MLISFVILSLLNYVFLSSHLNQNVHIQYHISGGLYYSFFDMSNHSTTFFYDLSQDATYLSTISNDGVLYNETLVICPFNNHNCRICYKMIKEVTIYYNDNKTFYIKEFPMFKLPNFEHRIDNTIGLSYKHRNINNNFLINIHELIDNNNFVISKENEMTHKGIISFGGFDNIIKQPFYNSSCKVNELYNYWGCNLKKIIFTNDNANDISYNASYYSLFQINQTQISVPFKLMNEVIKPLYIEKYIKEGLCKQYEISLIERILCKCEIVSMLPKVIFVFDDVGQINGIEVESKYLFEKYGKDCKFLIEAWRYKGFNHIIFGNCLFRNLDVLFDYNESKITFYSDVSFNRYFKYNVQENNEIELSIIITKVIINILLFYTVYLFIYVKCIKLDIRDN